MQRLRLPTHTMPTLRQGRPFPANAMTAELIIDFEDATTADELREAITNVCFRARREFPVVGTPLRPTAWDRRHAELNRLLTELEHATR